MPPLKPAYMDTPSNSPNLGAKKLMLQYKQSKVSSHPSAIIDLTKSPPRKKLKSPKTWIQNNLYTLSVSAKNRILSPTAWLSDDIIEAAQALIRDSNPLMGGLQLPYLGQTCSFSIERGQFIQILHNGADHWLIASNVGLCEFGFTTACTCDLQPLRNCK